jgi:hypothetical protein
MAHDTALPWHLGATAFLEATEHAQVSHVFESVRQSLSALQAMPVLGGGTGVPPMGLAPVGTERDDLPIPTVPAGGGGGGGAGVAPIRPPTGCDPNAVAPGAVAVGRAAGGAETGVVAAAGVGNAVGSDAGVAGRAVAAGVAVATGVAVAMGVAGGAVATTGAPGGGGGGGGGTEPVPEEPPASARITQAAQAGTRTKRRLMRRTCSSMALP